MADLKAPLVTFDQLVIPAIVCGLIAKAVQREGRLPRKRVDEIAAFAFAVVTLGGDGQWPRSMKAQRTHASYVER